MNQAIFPIHGQLPHLGYLHIQGPEAEAFLQSQLTNDVHELRASTQAQWTGYCNPKGRLYFTGWLAKLSAAENTYALLIDRSLTQAVIKRLRMFVLRAKLSIEDYSDRLQLSGSLAKAGSPEAVAVAEKSSHAADIRLPMAHTLGMDFERSLVCIEAAQPINPERLEQTDEFAAAWRWLHILAGEAWLTQQTSERFVPQMLNFERLGGVNFRKGCYPGQEVVARSQYLGKLKRRSLIYRIDDPMQSLPAEGQDLGETSNPNLTVVNVEPCPGRLGASLWQGAFFGKPEQAQTADALILAEGRTDQINQALGKPIELPYALTEQA
ncbi:MAG: folate-binding protein [Betaproteobacteria bacterium]|nr:folate-binding protein [Pseudomonadota bacterium]NBO95138.1 folate-binding protein [Betaproteobacteria bacterium]NBP36073.1 folate-binding protein [Betaproteobacteria bacterium]NBP37585.1 folate-binding protein [Betaproteobacteria bacterium]NBQ78971.1 folate-binding protein [Betaproteobacteria bacterium]